MYTFVWATLYIYNLKKSMAVALSGEGVVWICHARMGPTDGLFWIQYWRYGICAWREIRWLAELLFCRDFEGLKCLCSFETTFCNHLQSGKFAFTFAVSNLLLLLLLLLLRIPNWNFRFFSLLNVDFKSRRFPFANATDSDIDIFNGRSVSVSMMG